MADCGATIRYEGGPTYTCTLPAGHKGSHCDANGPLGWTSSYAVPPPRDPTWPR